MIGTTQRTMDVVLTVVVIAKEPTGSFLFCKKL
jgi:hypothetical protein